jgi:hypothetical protein
VGRRSWRSHPGPLPLRGACHCPPPSARTRIVPKLSGCLIDLEEDKAGRGRSSTGCWQRRSRRARRIYFGLRGCGASCDQVLRGVLRHQGRAATAAVAMSAERVNGAMSLDSADQAVTRSALEQPSERTIGGPSRQLASFPALAACAPRVGRPTSFEPTGGRVFR